MVLAAIIVVILVVVGVGVYYLTRPPSSPPGTTGPQVTLKDDGGCGPSDTSCYFTPTSINANVSGAAVVWTNQGSISHEITTCDSANGATSSYCPNGMNAAGLDSFNLQIAKSGASGDTVSHVFTKAGTYYYYCGFHPFTMHGTVVVS